jgi:D-alanyl-D-alanine dipeptidase
MSEGWTDLTKVESRLIFDIRYATRNNFLKKAVYPGPVCVARKRVADALFNAQHLLRAEGLGLKIFDAYRPLSVQKIMWRHVPDERYIANPAFGSRHNRGAAIDLTLVDRVGNDMTMPSAFDHFGVEAHRNFSGSSIEAATNSKILEAAMVSHGFIPFATEWWHFDHQDWAEFPVEDIPLTEWMESPDVPATD